MAITNSFRDAVSSENVKGIRIMMKNSLLVDPSFSEFNEMSRLAAGVIGLYDSHDGRVLQSDVSSWNDDYMNTLMVQVVRNFSKERIEHLKAVVQHLHPITPKTAQTNSQKTTAGNDERRSQPPHSNSYQEQKRHDQKSGNIREVKIAGGAVAGAAIGGTIAAVASMTVLGGAAIGAVVGGVAVAFITRGE